MEFRLGRRALVVPAIAAILIAAAGVGGFALTRDDARDRDTQRFLRTLTPAQLEFASALNETVADFSRESTTAAASPGIDSVSDVGPEGVAAGGAATRAVFVLARGTGMMRATGPLVIPGHAGRVVLLVRPRYQPGAPIATTAERRAALVGYTIAEMVPSELARQHLPSSGGTVVVSDGGTAFYRSGPPLQDDDHVVRARMDVGGRSWLIAARPTVAGPGGTPAVVLMVSMVLALGMLLTGRALHEVESVATTRALDREEDLSTIAGLSPLLQQSLELGEVLPAASSYLSDRFSLEGIAISYVDDTGALVRAFSLGPRVPGMPEDMTAVHATPSEIRAGEPFTIPLLRGGRAIGIIHALPARNLGPERTRTLLALADMFGTAVANARQYEREQLTVRRLQELDRMKTEFLGTVSHELRTPIAAIVGFSGLLDAGLEHMPIEEQRDFLARLMRNAASLSSLVQDLLDFSRIGRPSFELHPEEIDLGELTARIIRQMATPDQEHRYVIDAPRTVWAFADADAVERIVSNLLSNAAKFSPPDSEISVALAQHAEAAVLTVDDMGPGVAEEDREHIFDRFYRGASAAAVSTRGAGIGLAVVKDVVERMRGSVTVDRAPTGGARFVVTLPARPTGSSSPSSQSTASQGGNP